MYSYEYAQYSKFKAKCNNILKTIITATGVKHP